MEQPKHDAVGALGRLRALSMIPELGVARIGLDISDDLVYSLRDAGFIESQEFESPAEIDPFECLYLTARGNAEIHRLARELGPDIPGGQPHSMIPPGPFNLRSELEAVRDMLKGEPDGDGNYPGWTGRHIERVWRYLGEVIARLPE